jgi:hypothetical protein
LGEVWGRELPGISEDRGSSVRKEAKERAEKMKIAWRYEGLGQFESSRGACCVYTWQMQWLLLNKSDGTDQALQAPVELQVRATALQKSLQFSATPLTWQNASRFL